MLISYLLFALVIRPNTFRIPMEELVAEGNEELLKLGVKISIPSQTEFFDSQPLHSFISTQEKAYEHPCRC